MPGLALGGLVGKCKMASVRAFGSEPARTNLLAPDARLEPFQISRLPAARNEVPI
jgi:hypothetical protein